MSDANESAFRVVDRIITAKEDGRAVIHVVAGPTPWTRAASNVQTAVVVVGDERFVANVWPLRLERTHAAYEYVRQQIAAARARRHDPEVTRVVFFGTRDDELILVQQIVPGVSLPTMIDTVCHSAAHGGRFPLAAALFIARAMAQVLVRWRDFVLTPDFVIAWDGDVRLARAAPGHRNFDVDAPYQTPESIGGAPFESAVHSHVVAHALYTMIAGKHPWVDGVIASLIQSDAPRLERRDVSPRLRTLIEHGMQKHPRHRGAIDGFAKAFDEELRDLGDDDPRAFLRGLLSSTFADEKRAQDEFIEEMLAAPL